MCSSSLTSSSEALACTVRLVEGTDGCVAAQVAADTQVDHLISQLSQLTQQDAAGGSGADMDGSQGGTEALISEVTARLVSDSGAHLIATCMISCPLLDPQVCVWQTSHDPELHLCQLKMIVFDGSVSPCRCPPGFGSCTKT
jgi:hypothetical protein